MSSEREMRRDRFLAALQQGPVLMGILNITPDSFSDGGRYGTIDSVMERAGVMLTEGCTILDVGGESTRPGSLPVSEEEELARVTPALDQLCSTLEAPISIDTYKSNVARVATQLGAVVINDVHGLQGDPAMASVVAESGSIIVITHNPTLTGTIIMDDVFEDMRRFFDKSIALAERAGVPTGHIILDPGVGFGKTLEQNLRCAWGLDKLQSYGLPLMLGVSRKSFIGTILGKPVEDRLIGTLVANMAGLMAGAAILRVHDVSEHNEMIQLFQAARRAMQ